MKIRSQKPTNEFNESEIENFFMLRQIESGSFARFACINNFTTQFIAIKFSFLWYFFSAMLSGLSNNQKQLVDSNTAQRQFIIFCMASERSRHFAAMSVNISSFVPLFFSRICMKKLMWFYSWTFFLLFTHMFCDDKLSPRSHRVFVSLSSAQIY